MKNSHFGVTSGFTELRMEYKYAYGKKGEGSKQFNKMLNCQIGKVEKFNCIKSYVKNLSL